MSKVRNESERKKSGDKNRKSPIKVGGLRARESIGNGSHFLTKIHEHTSGRSDTEESTDGIISPMDLSDTKHIGKQRIRHDRR